MQQRLNVITYQDELLADGSVRRTFSDGRYEWRRRLPDGRVEWRDSQGFAGIDELLGDGVLKRTFNQGRVIYAREQGYGRTLWHRGQVLTVNQTSFGGRVGAILMGMGAGFLLGSLVLPPEFLSPEEEELLRQKLLQQQQQVAGGGGWAIGSSTVYAESHTSQLELGEGATYDSSDGSSFGSGDWGSDGSSFDGGDWGSDGSSFDGGSWGDGGSPFEGGGAGDMGDFG